MRIIETKIKNAFGQYQKDANLLSLIKEIASVSDNSVRSRGNAAIMYDAIRKHCPKLLYECVYYDGEHGEYHLFDFDPNPISRKSLLIEVRSRLQHECHIDPENIDRAMESVYLLNVNTLIRIKS